VADTEAFSDWGSIPNQAGQNSSKFYIESVLLQNISIDKSAELIPFLLLP